MSSAQKEVKVKVATEEELSGVEALELRIDRLNKQRIQLQIDTNSKKLEETQSRIEQLKQEKAQVQLDVNDANNKLAEIKNKIEGVDLVINTWVDLSDDELEELQAELARLEEEKINLEMAADDSQIKKIDAEIAQLDQESLDLQLKIETGELQKAKAEAEDLDGTTIDVDVNNIKAMEAVDQISQGFDRLKQGASEVKNVMGDALEASGRMENTETFLAMNIGADQAKSKLEEIRSVTDKLPGDDVTLQNLLSQATVKDISMGADAMTQMGQSAADYMAAMQNFGKNATETQQDLMNYILAGNTAEIERSPILQAHVDKLKEGTTVQERAKLLQEALNAEGWAGISQQDTYNNKFQQFNDMLSRGQMNLGNMFNGGAKSAMDFIMKLDESSNGLIGMGIALGGFATPLTDTLMGLGQMATGINAIKELGFIKWLKDLEIANKLAKISQLELNLAFLTNPIFLVVAAIVALIAILGYLYFNNEQVRAAVDGLGQSLMGLGQWIYNGAIYWLQQLQTTLMNLWNYIFTLGGLIPANVNITGNQIIDTILRVIAFIATLPMQLTIIFLNIIAKALGFGDNFTQRMITGAVNAVNGFISWISTLPSKLAEELDKMLQMAKQFALDIANALTGGAAGMVIGWITGSGEHSPGFMYDAFLGEKEAMEHLAANFDLDMSKTASRMVDSFNPELSVGFKYKDSLNATLDKNNKNSTGQINNFYFNDTVVDDDSRMERIYDYISRKLSFNNSTAGRTV